MINVSSKVIYGLTALLELAYQFHSEPVQIRTISSRHQIPHHYLEQVLNQLKKAGFVKSFRGSQGGYSLASSPDSIEIVDVIQALSGPLLVTGAKTGLDFYWKHLENEYQAILSGSLADLLHSKQREMKTVMYCI